MESFPTPFELFGQYRPRFEVISLFAVGWGGYSSQDKGKSQQRMYLRMRRNGHELRGYTSYGLPYVDYAESGLPFEFTYDRSQEKTIHEQLDEKAMSMVDEHLRGRTVLISPAQPFTEASFQQPDFDCNRARRDVLFELQGDPIPGLSLPKPGMFTGIYAPWQFFVPGDSPEGKAIVAAYKHHAADSQDVSKISDSKEAARSSLVQALAAVQ